jgi:Zn-dependent peptidase ImmA (M78 family)
MKLPKFFNVFGLKPKLKIVEMNPNFAGQYDTIKNVITLNSLHESDQELLHSLMHELGHCMFYRVSINQAVSYETHEFIVNNYATMLLENFDIKPKASK